MSSSDFEEKICYETKVYKNGNEVFVSDELRRKLYGVLSYLPLRKVIDKGLKAEDRKRLGPRDAFAVSMLDERILIDKEFQQEVKGYLLEMTRFEKNFPVGELEKDESALYALFYLAHECVKHYKPVKDKETIYERAERKNIYFTEEIYGRKK